MTDSRHTLLPATRSARSDINHLLILHFHYSSEYRWEACCFPLGLRDPVWGALRERPYRQQIGVAGVEKRRFSRILLSSAFLVFRRENSAVPSGVLPGPRAGVQGVGRTGIETSGLCFQVFGDKDSDGFYRGESGGRTGYIPCNMVAEVAVDSPAGRQQLLQRGFLPPDVLPEGSGMTYCCSSPVTILPWF